MAKKKVFQFPSKSGKEEKKQETEEERAHTIKLRSN